MPETYDVRAAVADALRFSDATTAPALMTIEMSGDAAQLLNQLTSLLEVDRGRVIAEALAFLYVGVTAQREGMHMGFVDPEGAVHAMLDLISRD